MKRSYSLLRFCLAARSPLKFRQGSLLAAIVILGVSAVVERPRAQQEPLVSGTEYGDPIQGMTKQDFELFRLGLEDFLEVEDTEEGLGPVFNGRSCAECHAAPAVGGVSMVSEFRAGTLYADGSFQEPAGGSLIHLFSIPPHNLQAVMPPNANVVASRRPIPLFGDGLVEVVPDDLLAALADPDDSDGDGISGRVHWVRDKETDRIRAGRFGWKAQQSSLFTFGAEAYRNEMGITSDLFPNEMCPGGDCEAIDFADLVPDPEDRPERSTGLRGIDNFASFMRLLGPPPRGEQDSLTQWGEVVFREVLCTSCHVPTLSTGSSPIAALDHKRFQPFGDFLLHDIGTGDGIRQGDAAPEEIRTMPLWGLGARAPFLHDGRAADIQQAVRMHTREGERSRQLFEALSEEDRDALLAFLQSL